MQSPWVDWVEDRYKEYPLHLIIMLCSLWVALKDLVASTCLSPLMCWMAGKGPLLDQLNPMSVVTGAVSTLCIEYMFKTTLGRDVTWTRFILQLSTTALTIALIDKSGAIQHILSCLGKVTDAHVDRVDAYEQHRGR